MSTSKTCYFPILLLAGPSKASLIGRGRGSIEASNDPASDTTPSPSPVLPEHLLLLLQSPPPPDLLLTVKQVFAPVRVESDDTAQGENVGPETVFLPVVTDLNIGVFVCQIYCLFDRLLF